MYFLSKMVDFERIYYRIIVDDYLQI